MELTKKKFWEDFWKHITLPQIVNYNFNNDRAIANAIKKFIPRDHLKLKAVEIGCAPGKWLIFFNKELDYLIDGYEYIPLAAQRTVENIRLNDIPDTQFLIYNKDFFKTEIPTRYDIVFSLGFIEHFQNFDEIMKKQVSILKKGGYLILGVPNFRGVNYFIQKFIDSYLNDPILPNHNLSVMKRRTLKELARRNQLKILFNDYIGGFEPELFNYNKISPKLIRFIINYLIRVLSILFKKINIRLTSGYLLAIYRKEAS